MLTIDLEHPSTHTDHLAHCIAEHFHFIEIEQGVSHTNTTLMAAQKSAAALTKITESEPVKNTCQSLQYKPDVGAIVFALGGLLSPTT